MPTALPYPATSTTHPTADPPDAWECSLHITNDPRAVRIARAAIRTSLRAFGVPQDPTETAELLTSELVSNAVQHADSPIHVRARTRDGVLRVSVWDNHPEFPQPLPLSTTDPFGRGLYLVHHLSRTWGHYPLHPTPGKVTWFELTT